MLGANGQDVNWWEVPLYWWRNDRKESSEREWDYQRARVYAAETQSGVKSCRQRLFVTLDECQTYVNNCCKEPWFERRFGTFFIQVIPKSHGSAQGLRRDNTRGKIWLPKWAYAEWVILHEMAHCLTPLASGGGHGRRWCYTYMDLVGHHIGADMEKRLRQAFLSNGVKTGPKRPATVIGAKCAELRSQYYTKPTTPKIEPAPTAFPDKTVELTAWVERELGWPAGSLKLRRDVGQQQFCIDSCPGITSIFWVGVFRLSDLTYAEWTSLIQESVAKRCATGTNKTH